MCVVILASPNGMFGPVLRMCQRVQQSGFCYTPLRLGQRGAATLRLTPGVIDIDIAPPLGRKCNLTIALLFSLAYAAGSVGTTLTRLPL